MDKKNVYLFEINDIIANQIKLPYSTGLILSYCLLSDEVTKNYNLDGWFYYRQEVEDISVTYTHLTLPTTPYV